MLVEVKAWILESESTATSLIEEDQGPVLRGAKVADGLRLVHLIQIHALVFIHPLRLVRNSKREIGISLPRCLKEFRGSGPRPPGLQGSRPPGLQASKSGPEQNMN